jgi:hypothetical protein
MVSHGHFLLPLSYVIRGVSAAGRGNTSVRAAHCTVRERGANAPSSPVEVVHCVSRTASRVTVTAHRQDRTTCPVLPTAPRASAKRAPTGRGWSATGCGLAVLMNFPSALTP